MNLKKKLWIACAVGFLNLSACSGGHTKTYGVPEKEWREFTAEQKQDVIEKYHQRGQRPLLESDRYWKVEWEKRRAEIQAGNIEWLEYKKTD